MKVLLLLTSSLLISCGCIQKKEIEAALWSNNGLPQNVCDQHPELLTERGLYRQLNNGKFELVSFCKKEIKNYLSIRKDEYEALIKKAYGNKGN